MNSKIYLALATLFTQTTNISLLIFSKYIYNEEIFSELIVLLSIVGIISSFAITKIDMILFQKIQRVDDKIVKLTLVVSIFFAVFLVCGYSIAIESIGYPKIELFVFLYIVSLIILEIHNFFNVQLKRYFILFFLRLIIFIFTILMFYWFFLNDREIPVYKLLGYCALVQIIIMVVDLLYICVKFKSQAAYKVYIEEIKKSYQRMLATSFSSGVNFLYLSVPILIAKYLGYVSFIADFGFISRFFTAAITIAKMVFGQIFIARLLEMQIKKDFFEINKCLRNTIFSSVLLYFVMAFPILIIFLFYGHYLDLNNSIIIGVVFLVGLCQVIINPLANIRIVSKQEIFYFGFDVVRLFILTFVMFLPVLVFEIRYGVASVLLYLSYFILVKKSLNLIKKDGVN